MDNKALLQPVFQAVIFDLDGVLMDSEWMGFQAWRRWAETHGGRLEEAAFPGMAGLTAEETALYVMEHSGVTFDVAESCAWVWQELLLRLRVKTDPLPGAVELVRELSRRGYPLAIASNSIAEYVDVVLSGLGLSECFPVRVTIEQVAQGKPAPEVYLRAAALLGVAPDHCLAVEDSRVGMQAAVAAGMRVIVVPGARDTPAGFDLAWQVFRSLAEVAAGLERILG
jgi:HAD superfamily hydrolase (TIGR01509 family)